MADVLDSDLIASGAIGAAIGVAFSALATYWVRRLLILFERREAEKRQAYVYLSKLSTLEAIKRSLLLAIKHHEQEFSVFKRAKKSIDDYDIVFIAIIHELIRTNHPIAAQAKEPFLFIFEHLSDEIKKSLDFKISDDDLVKMPPETIPLYQAFVSSADSVRVGIDMWHKFLEEPDSVPPRMLYTTWRSLKKLDEATQKLTGLIMAHGDISTSKYEELVSPVSTLYELSVLDSISADEKMENALNAARLVTGTIDHLNKDEQ